MYLIKKAIVITRMIPATMAPIAIFIASETDSSSSVMTLFLKAVSVSFTYVMLSPVYSLEELPDET